MRAMKVLLILSRRTSKKENEVLQIKIDNLDKSIKVFDKIIEELQAKKLSEKEEISKEVFD